MDYGLEGLNQSMINTLKHMTLLVWVVEILQYLRTHLLYLCVAL
jgi:hypothetical protein